MADSGVTLCGCRDCFETVMSNDVDRPDLCTDCEAAGCERYCTACGTGDTECSAPDAYDDPGYDPFGPDAAVWAELDAEA